MQGTALDTRVRRTLRRDRSAPRLGDIDWKGYGRSIPRRRRLSLSENGNPFVRFADISPNRGISLCHFVTSPQRGAPLPYDSSAVLGFRVVEGADPYNSSATLRFRWERAPPYRLLQRPTIQKPSGFPDTIHHSLFTIHRVHILCGVGISGRRTRVSAPTPTIPLRRYSGFNQAIMILPRSGQGLQCRNKIDNSGRYWYNCSVNACDVPVPCDGSASWTNTK